MATLSKLLERARDRHRAGDLARAEAGYREVLARNRTQLDSLRLLSELLHSQGRHEAAAEYCRAGLAAHPDSLHLHSTLANALTELGRPAEALAHHDRCTELAPHLAEVWNNRGVALLRLGRNADAAGAYERALVIDPSHVAALTNLANLRRDQGRSEEAIIALARALERSPKSAVSWNSLGACLSEQGRVEEAIACFRRALEHDHGYVQAHSNLLLNLHYVPHDPAAVFAEHLRFGERFPAATPPPLDWEPGRPLRVGYVSADYRRHSVAFFLEPVLSCHDRRRFEVYCYSAVRQPDAITAQFRALAGDRWREIAGRETRDIVEMIRRDGIHILIDVGGHTSEGAEVLFAARPAPIQVSWLGYPDTSGLRAMTHRITDRWADPVGVTDAWHTETLVRLESGFSCYRPPRGAPAVTPLPCLAGAPFTFVSFNNLAKVNPAVLALWARVLGAVPGSRLMLKARGITGRAARDRILAVFAAAGVGADRIECVPMVPDLMQHLACYGAADVALDTFPYHGTTTTCEALWMGVPVLTLAGVNHVARTGVSLLERAGLGAWIAADEESFVERAVRAATSGREDLARLRAGLRDRMARSTVTGAEEFTAALEKAYARMGSGESFASLDWFEEGNRLYQSGQGAAAAACYRSALLARDAFPEAWYNLGVAIAGDDPEGAQACYHRTLELDPRHAGAANNLGNLLEKAGHTGRAISFYRQALDTRPDFVEPRYNLGVILQGAGRLEEARAAYIAVLERDPDHANAWNNLGGISLSFGQPERAGDYFDRAIAADPRHPDGRWNRALVYLQMGDFERGWPLYEVRREQPSFPRPSFSQPAWRGEPVAGRRLLVWAEQGLGDAIQFGRFLRLVPGAVFECPARLLALFEGLPEITAVAKGTSLPGFDMHTPLMSLPYLLGTRPDTIPPPLGFEFDPAPLGPGFKVGLSWAGNAANPTGRIRSMPVEALQVLQGIDGVRLFSLQRGEACPAGVLPLEREDGTIADTARAIAGLDLVITVDTMTAHLAGSLGRPVWTLLPLAADWRWMSGETTPWYPSMRLWRQSRRGDWREMMARVRAALERMVIDGSHGECQRAG